MATLEIETRRHTAWVRDFLRDVGREAQPDAIREITRLALSMLEARTPVRSGRARGGWNADLFLDGVRSKDAGNFATFAEDSVGGAAFSVTTDRRFRSFSTIFSRVPYIIRLEFGWSRQAPQGMIRLTFLELASRKVLVREMMRGISASGRRTNQRHGARG